MPAITPYIHNIWVPFQNKAGVRVLLVSLNLFLVFLTRVVMFEDRDRFSQEPKT